MKTKAVIISVFATLLAALLFLTSAYAVDNFMRSDVYTANEYEDMTDFDLSVLERTSLFHWTAEGGTAPEQKYENGLPAYLLLTSSESCIAEYYASPSEPIDAYDYRELSFAIRVKCGENDTYRQSCNVILSLSSGEEKFECTGIIYSGVWNVITFDVSPWKYRKSITELTVSIVGSENYTALDEVAMSGPYVKEKKEPSMGKFMSEGLYASGAEIELIDKGGADESLRIKLNAQRINIGGVAAVPYVSEDCNAIRILLSNDSNLTAMQFSYNYFNVESGRYAASSETLSITPMSDRVSYIIQTVDVSLISNFSLILDSAGAGTVTIHSITPVSVYHGYTGDVYGAVSECKVDKSGKSIVLSGSVFHNYLISHADRTLACFMLASGESIDDVISEGREPVSYAKMSSKFSFEMKLKTLGEYALISKYAVVSISEDGDYTLLMSPVSVSGSFSTAETAQGRVNIKGIEYENISYAIDCGVGASIIDVYLDRLVSPNHSGHLYTAEKTFIYFDSDYVSMLDKKIKNLSASGCKVYLRLLISSEADRELLPYASGGEAAGAYFLAVDISSEEAERHFYSAVDFLASRYSKISNGKISGMILGKSIDIPDIYNYSENKNSVEYALMAAKAFEIMARCAVTSIEGFEAIFPISDIRYGKAGFDSELLLTSVCKYLEEGGGLTFSLLLEGTRSPYENGAADETSDYYLTGNLYVFERMLASLSNSSKNAPVSYLYSWTPRSDIPLDELLAGYVFNYYSIMFSEKASAFVLSLPGGEQDKLGDLSYLMKYIDTVKNRTGTLTSPLLGFFGADSWKSLIASYDEELITYRIFYEASSLLSLPEAVIGSYALWDFSSAFGTLDWFAGCNCSSVYVDATARGGKALCAVISDGMSGGEYTDIVYNYEYPEDISLIPYIEFEFYIDDAEETLYEVLVIIGGNGHRLEVTSSAHGGENASIIISTAEHAEMKQMDNIRFCVRPISVSAESNIETEGKTAPRLYLKSVKAYSESEDDASFATSILKARAIARNSTLAVASDEAEEPKYELIIAMAVIIVLGVAMVGFYDKRTR